MRKLLRRLNYLIHRRRIERELEEEMAAHRAMMEPGRKQAFGSSLRIREQTRDVWGITLLDSFLQDLRFALRGLRTSPGLTATALLMLSLGIGANIALFQGANVYLIQPPHVEAPETLVQFMQFHESPNSSGYGSSFHPDTAAFIRDNSKLLQQVIFHRNMAMAWNDDLADEITGTFVTLNYFDVLGAPIEIGRTFDETVDLPGEPPVAVISWSLWQRRLGADSNIVGKTIRVNDRSVRVIGVAGRSFPGLRLEPSDLWFPLDSASDLNAPLPAVSIYARLKPEVTTAAIREESESMLPNAPVLTVSGTVAGERNWLEPFYATNRFERAETIAEDLQRLAMIGSLTLLVLLIACANLSNLLLARTIARLRELGIRAALGASRWRVLRQLITESFLMTFAGSCFGIAVGWAIAQLIASVTAQPSYIDFSPDWRTIAVACALTVLATVTIGLIPALRVIRYDLTRTIKDGGFQASSSLQRSRLVQAMVALQIAGSCLLLIFAGLVVRDLRTALRDGLGYDYHGVAVLNVPLYQLGIEGEAARAYWQGVADQVATLPGVTSVALAQRHPLSDGVSTSRYESAPGLP